MNTYEQLMIYFMSSIGANTRVSLTVHMISPIYGESEEYSHNELWEIMNIF